MDRALRIEELRRVHEGDEEGEAFHGPATLRILEGVTAAQAAAKPIPHAHSIWEILAHVLATRVYGLERLAGGPKRPMPDEESWPPVNPMRGG